MAEDEHRSVDEPPAGSGGSVAARGREIGVFLAALVVSALLGFRLDLEPRVGSDFFFASDDPQLVASQKIAAIFPGASQILLATRSEDPLGEASVDFEGTLKATMAIVDVESANAVELSGTFVALDEDSFSLLVEGVTYIVWFDDDTKVLRIGEVDGKLSSELISIEELEPGDEIEVHGVGRVDTSVDAATALVSD